MWWRLSLNSSTPSFTVADNPAAHAPSAVTQILSVGRYWVLHARLLLLPDVLSFDWSMGAVPLVSSIMDIEVLPLILLLSGMGAIVCKTTRELVFWASNAVGRLHPDDKIHHESCEDALNNNSISVNSEKSLLREKQNYPQPIHVAFALAVLVVPFLPASNLMAWVGFVAAERVLYVPSMGASLLIALGAQSITVGLPGNVLKFAIYVICEIQIKLKI